MELSIQVLEAMRDRAEISSIIIITQRNLTIQCL